MGFNFSRSKYRAKPMVVDGKRYASQAEGRRAIVLHKLATDGLISDLQEQVAFPIKINDIKVFTYRCDFVYKDQAGTKIVEDVKGFKTPIYKLKKKCVEAYYKIKIKETR